MKLAKLFRPRVSLLSFLLLVTIVSLAVSHWRMSANLREAESELQRFQDAFGQLTIQDESKFHAISIPTGIEGQWRWRVYTPQGKRYRIHAATRDITSDDPPTDPNLGRSNAFIDIPPQAESREVEMIARISYRTIGPGLDLKLDVRMANGNDAINASAKSYGLSWQLPETTVHALKKFPLLRHTTVFGEHEVESSEPDVPIILLRKRYFEKLPPSMSLPKKQWPQEFLDPAPGFMIWLTEE